jgi:hypothetical protein
LSNRDIATVAEAATGLKEVTELTPRLLAAHGGVLPGAAAAVVIVQTNEGRWAKLLVQPARQRVGGRTHSIVLIERFVTFREGTERAVQASGQNVQLYPGFVFNLDLGQVVPEGVGGDLVVSESSGGAVVRPAGKAKVYVMTQAPTSASPTKSPKPTPGEPFRTSYFNGTYKLIDDGRRSGTLKLTVNDTGELTGAFYSDKDGEKYDVYGKVGNPRHAVQFTIKFPRVEQTFQGHLFTGDARAIAGTSRLQERDAGFYAVRVEE